MAKGWIAVHRQLQDHWLWDDKPFSKGQAWIDLLMMANRCDRKFLLGSELVHVQAGDVVTSIAKLCDRWGWSNNKVVRFLKLLEEDGMIMKKSDAKKTVVTIENYSKYSILQNEKAMPERCESDAEAMPERCESTQTTIIDNYNNYNNEDNYIRYAEIKDAYNQLCPSLPAVKSLSDARRKAIKARLNSYTVDDLNEAFMKAEASDFLKGKNDRNWRANFDWILKDANIAKILDGLYDNRQARSQNKAADKLQESYDMMKEWSES